MGVLTGYLGAAPSLVWASGAFALVLAPVLVPLAVWIYTLVFAFSALWFAHFALAALQALRAEPGAVVIVPAAAPGSLGSPDSRATLLLEGASRQLQPPPDAPAPPPASPWARP